MRTDPQFAARQAAIEAAARRQAAETVLENYMRSRRPRRTHRQFRAAALASTFYSAVTF